METAAAAGAASAAEIEERVDALHRLLKKPAPSRLGFNDLSRRLSMVLFGNGPLPDDLRMQLRPALRRKLGELGPPLAALIPSLPHDGITGGVSGGRSAATANATNLMLPASDTLHAAAFLLRFIGNSGAEACRLGAAIPALLRSGGAALERALHAGLDCAQEALFLAASQLQAISTAVLMLEDVRGEAGYSAAVVSLFPPADVVPWLSALTRALTQALELHGTSGSRCYMYGESHMQGVPSWTLLDYCTISNALLVPWATLPFGNIQTAFQAAEGLPERVAALLLRHALPAAVAGVLHPERSCVQASWQFLSNAARSLLTGSDAVTSLLQQHQGQAAALRLAAQLVEQLPLVMCPELDDSLLRTAWVMAVQLLSSACSAVKAWGPPPYSGWQLVSGEVAGRVVLRLLPRLAAALRNFVVNPDIPAAQQMLPEQQAVLLAGAANCLTILTFVTRPGSTTSQWLELLAAANAAVRLLPHLQRCWLEWQQEAAEDVRTAVPQLAGAFINMSDTCLALLGNAAQLVSGRTAVPASSPGHQAAAVTAARQLHMSACRLVHWLAAEADPGWRAALHPVMISWQIILSTYVQLAQGLHPLLDGHATVDAARLAAPTRTGAGCCAAWWEVLQVGAAQLESEGIWAREWTLWMLCIAPHVPGSLLTPGSMQRLATATGSALREGQGKERLQYALKVLKMTTEVHALAALFTSGVAAEVMGSADAAPAACCPDEVTELTRAALTVQQVFQFQIAHASGQQTEPASSRNGSSTQSVSSNADSEVQQQLAVLGQQLLTELLTIKAQNACILDTQQAEQPFPLFAGALERTLPTATAAAELLQQHWQAAEGLAAGRLELAQAAATRSCAYLRCANLGAGGGAGAGEGEGSKRCSGCRMVRYCGTACSHADWRGLLGHKHVCKALAAARQQAPVEGP